MLVFVTICVCIGMVSMIRQDWISCQQMISMHAPCVKKQIGLCILSNLWGVLLIFSLWLMTLANSADEILLGLVCFWLTMLAVPLAGILRGAAIKMKAVACPSLAQGERQSYEYGRWVQKRCMILFLFDLVLLMILFGACLYYGSWPEKMEALLAASSFFGASVH